MCLVDDAGEVVARTAGAPDADGLRHLTMRVGAGRVRAVIESMNGARFVHDRLEELGWEVLIADTEGQGAGALGVQDRQVSMDCGPPGSDEMLGTTRRARSPCR